jgi:hypothetical protein
MQLQDHSSDAVLVSTSLPEPTSLNASPPDKMHSHDPNDTSRGYVSTDSKQVYKLPHPASWFKTYRAGFVNACVLLPTLTALLTIFFYFLIPTLPWMPYNHLSVLIAGVLSAFFTTALVAFFRRSAATYEEGNVQSYSNSEICLNKLESRLTIMKQIDTTPPKYETVEDELLRKVGIKEAECALDQAKYICVTCNGYQWLSGAGYAYLQQALNQVEEALITIEPISLLISEAKHDQAALQDANMSNNIQLFDQLQQAIEDLNANYNPPKRQKDIVDFLWEKLEHFLYYLKRHANQQQQQLQHSNTEVSLEEGARQARITIYFVRQTLNDFRINRLFELVQQRSNLVLAITVTGVITYILVCLALLSSVQDLSTIFQSGTAYFFVGAAAGLFGRLYSVSTADRTINSYGLPTARTNAAAHLSGIAGVGGVFVIQALLQVANFTYPGHSLQPFAFSLPNLLIAATFGLTPNLLIKNLQKQAERSISDLESTKPSVIGKVGN